MKPKSNRHIPRSLVRAGRNQGFALVVTLSLMVLLSVLAIGLMALASIELRAGSHAVASQEARANARLALLLALGELQGELGPDKRVSAPGGQQFEDGDKSGGMHWTGVYDAWPASVANRPAPAFRRWLVSGDDRLVSDPRAPKIGLSGGKIALVRGDAEHDAVEAALLGTPGGACAWWVGDQNTKAKLGGALSPAADAKVAAARMQAAPRAAHEAVLGEGVSPADPALDRLVTAATVDLVARPAKPLFHHATTDSCGLLVDVRAGGFRKDLNFLLEKQMSQAPKTPLYTAGSTPGINFGELWLDHNVWAEVAYPSSPPKHADGGAFPAKSPFLIGLGDPSAAKADPFLPYRHVTKLQATLLFSLISERRTGAAGRDEYDLYLVVDPIFTIWNPFNVSVQIPSSAFTTFKTWAIPYDLDLVLKGGPGGDKNLRKSIRDLVGQENFFNAELGRVQNLVLRPGEVQVVSQGFGEPIRLPGTNGGYFDAKLGWDFGSGYKYLIDYETDPLKKDGSQRVSYSMAPNATTALKYGLFLSGHSIGKVDLPGNPTNHIGSFSIDLLYSRSGGTAITAAANPKVFPSLPYDPSAEKSIASLAVAGKWPICVYTFGLRTEMDPLFDSSSTPGTRFTGRALLRSNPKTLVHDMFNLDPALIRSVPLQVGMRRVNSLSSPIIECDAKGLGYFGAEYGANNGSSHVVTHSVPLEPIHSLGALQHSVADGTPFGASRGEAIAYLLPSVSHPIANSFAPSILPPDQVRGNVAGRDVADHSYLANEALWDRYFHSSITPRSTSANRNRAIAYKEQKDRLAAFLGAGGAEFRPLPNERMRAWSPDPDATLAAIFPSSTPASSAADRIASFLMVDGAFNVNSTSVTAWKSFLSGLKGAEVPVRPSPALAAEASLVPTGNTPVAALLSPAGGEIAEAELSDPGSDLQWRGFRSLSDGQIDELARALVKQVRKRGPFLSLADFVNRRPGSDRELALSGPLQSALDDKDVSINAAFRDGERSLGLSDASAQGFAFPEAEAGAKAVGAPGYVKQGDLLTSLGPLIAVRGDTFIIRAYGESRDVSGEKVLARAWCEALVQRVPDFVDPSDLAHVAAPQSKVNQVFGRRFEVLSFRFLHPGEIA